MSERAIFQDGLVFQTNSGLEFISTKNIFEIGTNLERRSTLWNLYDTKADFYYHKVIIRLPFFHLVTMLWPSLLKSSGNLPQRFSFVEQNCATHSVLLCRNFNDFRISEGFMYHEFCKYWKRNRRNALACVGPSWSKCTNLVWLTAHFLFDCSFPLICL